jgi:hypothetical protein
MTSLKQQLAVALTERFQIRDVLDKDKDDLRDKNHAESVKEYKDKIAEETKMAR